MGQNSGGAPCRVHGACCSMICGRSSRVTPPSLCFHASSCMRLMCNLCAAVHVHVYHQISAALAGVSIMDHVAMGIGQLGRPAAIPILQNTSSAYHSISLELRKLCSSCRHEFEAEGVGDILLQDGRSR